MKIFKRKEDQTSKLLKDIINDNPIPLSEEAKEKWKDEFKELVNSLVTTSRLESEKFDKGILTLSSIFLGFTLTFVDKIVSLHTAWYKWMLFTSWITFFISIVSILVGLLVNQKSLIQIINNARKYFVERNANYSNFADNKLNWIADKLNFVSLILFVIGAGSFVLFVVLNVNRL